jgi:hypothetical protein
MSKRHRAARVFVATLRALAAPAHRDDFESMLPWNVKVPLAAAH